MGSFRAKIGWKRLRKRENKTIASFRPYPTRNRKFKKIAKKFKKLKNTIINSFQTEINGKRMRNRENKNYNFVPFLPDA